MKSKLYLYSLVSGVLLGAAFPPLPTWLGVFVGFVPLLLALRSPESEKRFARLLYVCFFVMHGISNWWVSSWQTESDPFLFVSGFALWLGHPFFFMLPFLGMRLLSKRFGSSIGWASFPFLWTAFEYLHSLGDLSYPWLTIGYTQAYNTEWVQIADIAGVWGVSFVIVTINVLISCIVREAVSRRSIHWRMLVSPAMFGILACAVLPWMYGKIRLEEIVQMDKKAPRFTAGVIQPNINPWKKWQGSTLDQVALHQKIQDSLNAFKHLDLAVWSETGVPFLGMLRSNPEGLSFLQPWINDSKTALLTGFSEFAVYNKEQAPSYAKPIPSDPTIMYNSFNAAILMQPSDGSATQQYPVHRKMRLTPFGENIPFGDVLPFLERWLQWGVGISSWTKGKVQKPLAIKLTEKDSLKIGCIICIESVYPGFVRNYAAQGANIFSVITNDAWYNYTFGPEQHYQISVLRAIENRRAIIRCANSGVSGFIAPTGYSYNRLKPYTSAGLASSVPLITETSLYTRYGDLLPIGCTILSLLGIIAARFKKRA